MHSALATAAPADYRLGSVEAVSRAALGVRKIKVGTTLTLVFSPRPDQSWYNPHFDLSRAGHATISAVLTHMFHACSFLPNTLLALLERPANR